MNNNYGNININVNNLIINNSNAPNNSNYFLSYFNRRLPK